MTETREHTQFGPYLIVRVSGAGGMGRVELALRAGSIDPDVCVLKRLHGALHDEEVEARFRRGAQIAAHLEHENIARTLRIEKIDGELCVAQELVEGVNLGKVMRQLGARPLPLGVAVHVVREVARALGYAHGFGRLGIVHRDVTPENVMLSFAGEVKLIDFGIARSAVDEAVTNMGVVVGRRSYVPPEAWEGTKVDCRADVFALGVVLWEVLTGRRAEETPEPVLPEPRELNPDVPPLLSQIVERAMAAAPEDRFQSADELGAALGSFVPAGADPRQELADLLGLCFNVELQRKLVADDVTEAKQFLRHRNTLPATSSLPDLAALSPAPPTVAMIAPAPTSRRGSSSGPWVAATIAAIVATSGIGLLRTHGRTARSRASAEPLGAPLPTPALPSPALPLPAAQPPVAPPVSASSTADLPAPEEAPTPPAVPAPIVARAPRIESPRRVVGRVPDAIARSPHNAQADDLLRRANDLWERGETTSAYALARQALAAGAGAPAHVLLGTLLIGMRNYGAAEPELEAATRLDPRNAEARRLLALLHKTAAERSSR
ncbi:MAG TPA: serine/threonine-protein kinase [Polyangia bacterium]|nr:serine/threonine-protein kinase [Polyangia bacterium]